MSLLQRLAVFALKRTIDAACKCLPVNPKVVEQATDRVLGFLDERSADHSQRLVSALKRANANAWRALEIALAGDSFWERCKVALARAEDQAFRQQVKAFLDSTPLPELAGKDTFRQTCLKELRTARDAGVLSGALDLKPATRQAAAFARFGNPQQLLDAEWQLAVALAQEMQQAGYPNLGSFLGMRPAQGPPLLVIAVRYFFRRAVEEDQKLFQGLAFAKLEAIDQAQERRFQALNDALKAHGERIEELLGDVRAVVTETRDVVLDLREGLKGTDERISQLGEQVQRLLETYALGKREVRPGDSCSIRNDQERQLVKQLVARYRALPEAERRRLPAMLHAVGKLQVVAGDFESAQQDFQAVARMVTGDKARAEAHFNAYQAALERRDWGGALPEFLQAVKLDARRFAPFPVGKYQPVRILGAGGFGVTFLCRHKYMDANVAVKALRLEELAADADKVFSEATLLQQLDHPAIIRMLDCGYVDSASKSRPFLVMEYFEGQTLEEHVEKHGPLPRPDAVAAMRAVAEGLAAAHGKNILHRDVKPANLLLRKGTGGWQVKLIDFGLALRQKVAQKSKNAETARGKKTLVGGSIAGTLEYAAPEQMGRRNDPIGPYSDVYGFAKTCCYALFQTTLPSLKHWQSIPQPLAALLGDCLAEAPQERPAGFGDVLKLLTPSAPRSPRPARAEPAPTRRQAPSSLRRVAVLLMLLVLGGAAAGLYFSGVLSPSKKTPGGPAAVSSAEVVVKIDQPGAEVFVDGKPIPGGREQESVKIEVAEGKHTLKVVKSGFEPYTKEFLWKAGNNEGVTVRLEPAAGDTRPPDKPVLPLILAPAPVTLQPGETAELMVRFDRRGHAAAIDVKLEGLPERVSARPAALAADRDSLRLDVTAAGDAPEGQKEVRIVGTVGDKVIEGRFTVVVARPVPVALAREVKVLRGHTDGVTCAAFSRDGAFVLSGSRDRSLRLWDVPNGQEKKMPDKHTAAVVSVGFVSGQGLAISSAADRTIAFWDLAASLFRGSSDPGPGIPVVTMSPAGAKYASGGWGTIVQLWEIEGGVARAGKQLEGHTERVSALTFSRDGARLLSGSIDRTVRLWDVQAGKELWSAGHTGEVLCVALSADDRMAVSGGDEIAILWDAANGKELRRFRGHKGTVTGAAFSPDNRFVVTGSEDRSVRLWDVQTARELGRFEMHEGPVRCVAFAPKGRYFVSGGDDRTLRLWEVTEKMGK